jgi:hypothetical protein
MMRWTPARLAEVRAYAAEGCTVKRAAERMGTTERALQVQASLHKIRFRGRRSGNREAGSTTLAEEIALAKAEAPHAPLYRGGWP